MLSAKQGLIIISDVENEKQKGEGACTLPNRTWDLHISAQMPQSLHPKWALENSIRGCPQHDQPQALPAP